MGALIYNQNGITYKLEKSNKPGILNRYFKNDKGNFVFLGLKRI